MLKFLTYWLLCLSFSLFANTDFKLVGHGDGFISVDLQGYGEKTVVGDFNNDGLDDIIFTKFQGLAGIYGAKKISKNNQFDFEVSFDFSSLSATSDENPFIISLFAHDLNNDNFTDLIVGIPYLNKVLILYGSNNWASNMTEFNFNHIITGPTNSLFGYSFALNDLDNDNILGISIGAPSYGGGDQNGAILYYDDISNDQNLDYILSGNINDNLGIIQLADNFYGTNNYSHLISGSNLYLIENLQATGNTSINDINTKKFIIANDSIIGSMSALPITGSSIKKPVFSVSGSNKVHIFKDVNNLPSVFSIDNAEFTISGNTEDGIGFSLYTKDIDQDGYVDLGIGDINSTSANVTIGNANGVVSFINGLDINSSANIFDYRPLITFYGRDFTLSGITGGLGDIDGDDIIDMAMGGISSVSVISSSLSPYPTIDIASSVTEGFSPISTILTSTPSFGSVDWYSNNTYIGSGNDISFQFNKGEYQIYAIAERNGFKTQSSPIKIVATNNPPVISPSFSEYTVNTGDTLTFYTNESDNDKDTLTRTLLIDGKETSMPSKELSYIPLTTGSSFFNVTVSDNTESVRDEIALTVFNNPPKIANQGFSLNTFLDSGNSSFTFDSSDYENDSISFAVTHDNIHQSFKSSVNTHSFDIANQSSGIHEVNIQLTDVEDTESSTFKYLVHPNITATKPPKISMDISKNNLKSGESFTVTLIYSDPDSTVLTPTLTFDGSAQSIDTSSNVITHTVDTTGKRGLLVVAAAVSDETGNSASVSRVINIANQLPLGTMTFSKKLFYPGESLSLSVTANDLDNDNTLLSYSFNDGSPTSFTLPASLNIVSNIVGEQTVNYNVSDSYNTQTIKKNFYYVQPNRPVDVSIFLSTNAGTVGKEMTVTAITSDPDNDSYSYDVYVDDVKQMTATSTQAFNYTPSANAHLIKVVSKDARGLDSTYKTYMFTGTNHPPVPSVTFGSSSVLLGYGLNINLSLFDQDNDAVTYKLLLDGVETELLNGTNPSPSTVYPKASGNSTLDFYFSDGKVTQLISKQIPVYGPLTDNYPNINLNFSKLDVDYNGTLNGSFILDSTPTITVNGTNVAFTSSGNVHSFTFPSTFSGSQTLKVSYSQDGYTFYESVNYSVYPDPTINKNPIVDFYAGDAAMINYTSTSFYYSVTDDNSLTSSLIIGNSTFATDIETTTSISATIKEKGKLDVSFNVNDGHSSMTTKQSLTSYNNIPVLDIIPVDNSITVSENVRINLISSDADNDSLTLSLKVNGVSKTIIEDNGSHYYTLSPAVGEEGNYIFELTATDGEITTSTTKNIEVTKIIKNIPPTINASFDRLTIESDEEAKLTVTLTDPDNSSVDFQLKRNGTIVSFTRSGNTITYTHKGNETTGSYLFTFTATDGINVVQDSLTLTVIPKNIPPVLNLTSSKSVFRVGESATIDLVLSDQDTEDLLIPSLVINDEEKLLSGNINNWQYIFTPTISGNIKVVGSVYDGEDTDTKELKLTVYPNYSPTLTIKSSLQYPNIGQIITFTITADDRNAEDVLTTTLTINGTEVGKYNTRSISHFYTPTNSGRHILKVTTTDGDNVVVENFLFFVSPVPVGGDSSTNTGISTEAAQLISSLESTISVANAETMINNLANNLAEQDLYGALSAFHITAADGLQANYNTPKVNVSVMQSSVDNTRISSSSPDFFSHLDNVPVGHSIVMASIDSSLDPNAPTGATGELLSIDMYSGNTEVFEGFSIDLTIEKNFNSNTNQFLYLKDETTGLFSDSGFTGRQDGENIVFTLEHFSTYVLVNKEKITQDTQTGTSNNFQNIQTVGDNGTGAGGGGGCFLK